MALDVVLQDAGGRVVDRLVRNEDGTLVKGAID
jgi:hypothetical protein